MVKNIDSGATSSEDTPPPQMENVGLETAKEVSSPASPDDTKTAIPGAMQIDDASNDTKRKSPLPLESDNKGIKKRAVLESRDECGPFRDIPPQFQTEEIENPIRSSLSSWKASFFKVQQSGGYVI
uniref:Uncharacterized protein n=1 Tax=Trichogramma kaykai TaxID=54128 RepID=A0ABD2VTG8_9HYME